jgi:hypothetical protein
LHGRQGSVCAGEYFLEYLDHLDRLSFEVQSPMKLAILFEIELSAGALVDVDTLKRARDAYIAATASMGKTECVAMKPIDEALAGEVAVAPSGGGEGGAGGGAAFVGSGGGELTAAYGASRGGAGGSVIPSGSKVLR